MKVEFKSSFVRDLERVDDRRLRARVKHVIGRIEGAANLQGIEAIKKLRGAEQYYRIRIGEYRLGLILEGDKVVFVRFLHRKEVYRYFP